VIGHKGNRTAALQRALNAKAGDDLSGDGEFGQKTLAAVRAFQKSARLPVTGRGDAATLAALGLAPAVDKPTEPAKPGTVHYPFS
jgi:peptidoglycan hydrolase-like protein with peptidoglycan-binding domain